MILVGFFFVCTFKKWKSDLNDSGQCHECKNEENGFRFSEGLRTSLNLPKHSWYFATTECARIGTKYLPVIDYGPAFRWLFLQIKTVQILLQLVFPFISQRCPFSSYANSNLCPQPQAKLILQIIKKAVSGFAGYAYLKKRLEPICHVHYIYVFLQRFSQRSSAEL